MVPDPGAAPYGLGCEMGFIRFGYALFCAVARWLHGNCRAEWTRPVEAVPLMSRISIAAIVALLATGAVAQRSSMRPVASVTEVMKAMVIPASNALFDVPRQVPEDDAAWETVRNHAIVLAESGNLLLMQGRAEDSEVWKSTSVALVEAGEAALEAAKARDVDAILEVGNQIIDACERCHEKHWIR